MTVDEVANFLRISRGMVYNLTKSEDFPTVRIGKTLRIRRDKLVEWLDRQS
jgi:excisionase family DNA binding protein